MRGEFRKSLVGDLFVVPANCPSPVLSVQSRTITGMSVRVEFRWPEGLVERIDRSQPYMSRSAIVRIAVERFLDAGENPFLQGGAVERALGDTGAHPSSRQSPAPAEQPVSNFDRLQGVERRVSPSGPLTLAEHNDAMLSSVPPGQSAVIPVYVSRRRDVKPFQRGGS